MDGRGSYTFPTDQDSKVVSIYENLGQQFLLAKLQSDEVDLEIILSLAAVPEDLVLHHPFPIG